MHNYFENIKGQDIVCKILQSQIDSNKISHAYLFCGPAGCGKLACAKALAKNLEGQNFSEKIENNTCPDVKIINPQGVNGYLIGQIKDIVKESNLSPIQTKYKIYIIRDSEKLGTASANAFLKTLEEPSKNVCFILLANDENNVLPTIVSRCQKFKFKALPYEIAVKTVQKESGCALEDAKLALDLFGGDTTKAIEFCLNQNTLDFYDEVKDIYMNLNTYSDWEILKRSADLASKINEIVDSFKAKLDDNIKSLSDVLEKSGLSLIEDQNKRDVNSARKDLLYLFCASLKFEIRQELNSKTDKEKQIRRLNEIAKFEQNLAYNIGMQNFCDVVLLKLKRI